MGMKEGGGGEVISLPRCDYCRKPIVESVYYTPPSTRDGAATSCSSSPRSLVLLPPPLHSSCVEPSERVRKERGWRGGMKRQEREENPEDGRTCTICGERVFKAGKRSMLDQRRWVSPCFCDIHAHHGCLVENLPLRKECGTCGVQYSYRTYGSIFDFLRRYSWSYSCFVGTLCFLIFMTLYTVLNAVFYPVKHYNTARMFLLSLGALFTGFTLLCCFLCCRYTFITRFPRFKYKYGHITVFDYVPGQNESRKKKKSGSSKLVESLRNGEDKNSNLLREAAPLHEDTDYAAISSKSNTSWRATSTPKAPGTAAPPPFHFLSPIDERCATDEGGKKVIGDTCLQNGENTEESIDYTPNTPTERHLCDAQLDEKINES